MKIKCTKCGDVIKSMYRHDFRWCKCGNVFIDGGDDYLRFGGEAFTDGTYELIDEKEENNG